MEQSKSFYCFCGWLVSVSVLLTRSFDHRGLACVMVLLFSAASIACSSIMLDSQFSFHSDFFCKLTFPFFAFISLSLGWRQQFEFWLVPNLTNSSISLRTCSGRSWIRYVDFLPCLIVNSCPFIYFQKYAGRSFVLCIFHLIYPVPLTSKLCVRSGSNKFSTPSEHELPWGEYSTFSVRFSFPPCRRDSFSL